MTAGGQTRVRRAWHRSGA